VVAQKVGNLEKTEVESSDELKEIALVKQMVAMKV
jgi:hypothetical protein